jgi:TolB-like protein
VIQLRVLGPIELSDGDRELTRVLAQPKRFALLAHLTIASNGFQRRDSLLALFWPELDDKHARSALNQALRFLRVELGGPTDSIIVSRGAEEVGIDRSRVWCDAVALQELLSAGRTAEALELYRGDLLQGFFIDAAAGFEDWLERKRASLRSQAAAAMGVSAEQLVPTVVASSVTRHEVPPSQRARSRIVAVAIVGLVSAVIWAWNTVARRDRSENLIAVLPFSIQALDSSYHFLREGMVELLYARLSDDSRPAATWPGAVIASTRHIAPAANGNLSEADAIAIAKQLRARQVMVGHVVATRQDAEISARVVDVKSGRLLAAHSVRGVEGVRLATRFADEMIAKMLGENPTRFDALSDHPDAVRAYLAGMRFYRNSRPGYALDAFARALEIDPQFASAAFWRAYIGWGRFGFGTPEKQNAESLAWALRGRLRRGDSLLLAALPSIGPNYPRPSTASDILDASERAARVNRHRPEAWTEWARQLLYWGSQAGVPRPLELATFVVDSAIGLDSTFSPALVLRWHLATIREDLPAIRKYRAMLDKLDAGRDPAFRWAAANVLRDSAHLSRLFEAMAGRPNNVLIPRNVELWASSFGIASMDDAERFVELRLRKVDVTDEERRALQAARVRIAALRGQRQRALYLMDSLGAHSEARMISIAEEEYDLAAEHAIRELEARANTTTSTEERGNALCDAQVWRVAKGDTTRARNAASEIRAAIATISAAPGWRIGHLDLCPLLLEAMLEHASGSHRLDARAKLRNLLLKGTMSESPGNVAYLLGARMFVSLDQSALALSLVRRRDPMSAHMIQPAAWLLEGKLALLRRDTAGAVHAYTRYLEIRDRPDEGLLMQEGRRVRRLLGELKEAAPHAYRPRAILN